MKATLVMARRASKLAFGKRGGTASIMLLAFMVLAVPIALGSIVTAGQLSRSSLTYDKRLTGLYDANSGVELAVHKAVNDPNFDIDLVPSSPSKEVTVSLDGNTTTATVTKVFPHVDLQGQGLSISKTVTPPNAQPNTQTTFTYTITIKNEGTDTVFLAHIRDYLPPYFTFVSGTTAGITTDNPVVSNDNAPRSCGASPYTLDWDLSPLIQFEVGRELTLTFNAQGTLPDGTYYNQAMVSYQPWWDGFSLVGIYTPYTAEATVGTGIPKCGYHADILVSKEVTPSAADLGVETEFTYTINIENTTAGDYLIQQIEDLLPPSFVYVMSSTSGITSSNPSQAMDPGLQRWRLTWGDGPEGPPLFTLSGGQTAILVFKATGTLAEGVNYLNEVSATFETPELFSGVEAYADVVLVLDNSGSISSSELQDLKQAASAIVDAFQLDTTDGRIRIGVARFRGSNASVVGMTDVDIHGVDEPLHDGINSLVQGGPDLDSGTNIVVGVEGGGAQFSTGLGDRPEVPNLMIFVTDGNDNRGNTLQQIEDAALASAAELFAVGVGSVNQDTLNAIASDPDSDHVFYTDDFDGLLALVNDIVSAALDAAKKVVTVAGGTSAGSAVSAGRLYDIQSLAQDGASIRSRVLVTPEDSVEMLSWQR